MAISAHRLEIANGGDDHLRRCEPNEPVDRELIERIAARDTQAMYELYLFYHSRVARLLYRISLQSGLVDEMVHDTFLSVWKRASEFHGDTRVAAWVYGIAYSRWRMTLRKLRSPDRGRAFQPGSTDMIALPFARLSSKQRAVLEFAYGLGLSREEIATAMRCTINAVVMRMKHARRRMSALTRPPSTSHSGADLPEATGDESSAAAQLTAQAVSQESDIRAIRHLDGTVKSSAAPDALETVMAKRSATCPRVTRTERTELEDCPAGEASLLSENVHYPSRFIDNGFSWTEDA